LLDKEKIPVERRATELRDGGVPNVNSFDHLKAIHRYLFQDVVF
jgi:fido (protein-threonine AMPylation protein)